MHKLVPVLLLLVLACSGEPFAWNSSLFAHVPVLVSHLSPHVPVPRLRCAAA